MPSFFVEGRARSQGSHIAHCGGCPGLKLRKFPPRVAEDTRGDRGKRLLDWRKDIAAQALVTDPTRIYQATEVDLLFIFERPQSNKDQYPTNSRIPDIDKLARAALDALQAKAKHGAGIMYDDSQVVRLVAEKRWAVPNEPEGLRVCLDTVGPMQKGLF